MNNKQKDEQQTKWYQLVELDPNKLEIHQSANLNPMMAEDQYKEFITKFEKGFDVKVSHIVLYKGKVVDGRHRVRACKELGHKLWGRNLPGTMTSQEIDDFVENTDNRRHQTPTQRAIGAYKYYKAMSDAGTPVSQEYAATHKQSNRKQLARVITLADLIGDDLINVLHNGNKIKAINPQTGIATPTDVLLTLINYFTNRNSELVVSTSVGSVLTDGEVALANRKFEELQLECNSMVLKQIARLINNQ